MPRLPLHPAAVYGVVKEMRTVAEELQPLVVAGSAAARGLVEALSEGGDPAALRDLTGREVTRYDLQGAALLLYVVEGSQPTQEDEKALKLADRSDVEVVCVLVGAAERPPDVPFVKATSVVLAPEGQPPPVDEIAELVAALTAENGYGLAARLPVLRPAVVETIVKRFSRQNGILGVAVFVPGADFPVLTLNQLRMVFRMAAAYGEEIDRERIPEILAVIGAGLGFRTIAREALGLVPGLGWAIKGGVAYVGTKALGKAASAYFEQGGADSLARAADAVRSRS
ncbi:MAG TPA: hypothetical protein VH281_02320 [Gaiellaceae bacterium]|jgi:uncharacterized protein (DUF697 family)